MPTLSDIRAQSTWGQVIEGQPQHAMIAILLAAGAGSLLVSGGEPGLWGRSAAEWARWSIGLALIHQVIVAVVFRLQLHRDLLSRLLGAHDLKVWGAIFMPLLLARPLTVLLTGLADGAPITGLRGAEIALGLVVLPPVLWGLHSTLVHFTLPRALGGDHFREEIRALPPVSGGIFDHTRNGMYGVVFLGLWAIALLTGSWNALVVALFQHAYIWVHMYCTEAPDLKHLHG